MARLTQPEIEEYREQGIVIPEYRLPDSKVDELRDALDQLIAENPSVRPEKLVSAHIEDGKEGVKGSRRFLDASQDPDLLDLVEGLIGSDIILWGCQVFCKPGDGTRE